MMSAGSTWQGSSKRITTAGSPEDGEAHALGWTRNPFPMDKGP